jgi:hypothetical protein
MTHSLFEELFKIRSFQGSEDPKFRGHNMTSRLIYGTTRSVSSTHSYTPMIGQNEYMTQMVQGSCAHLLGLHEKPYQPVFTTISISSVRHCIGSTILMVPLVF